MKSLQAWLSWQETLHPQEIELGLARIRPVAIALGLLAPEAKVVTVAGTNGKGSSIALLESMVRSGGLRCGVYTSPHLLRYNERIRIDGEMVSDHSLCEAFAAIDQARGEISLTYFEFGTLAAFYLFNQQPLDLWILEVGLGGRLDAVNLVDADVALLTTVDLDHQAWLGETREQIGREKAGIFRAGCPAVVGEKSPPCAVVEYAAGLGTPLRRSGVDFAYRTHAASWDWLQDGKVELAQLPLPALAGAIQLHNSAVVLEVVAQLGWLQSIGSEAIARGLQSVSLPGRFQTIANRPQVVVDVSHNPQAAAVLAENLSRLPAQGTRWAVVGMLRDKEVERVVETLSPQIDRWVVCGLALERGLSVAELAAVVERVTGMEVERLPDPLAAYRTVLGRASADDRVVVFGSFHMVAALLEDQ